MKVLVVNDFVAFPGGGTSVAHFTAEGLKARGHEVSFLAGMGAPAERPQAAYPIVSLGLQDVRAKSRLKGLLDGVYSLAAGKAVRAVLSRFSPDDTVVVLHQWTRVLSPAVFEALRAFRTLVYAHDYFLACPTGSMYRFDLGRPCRLKPMSPACLAAPCDRESRLHKLVRIVRTALQTWLLARMRACEVVCVSHGQAARYAALFPRGRPLHALPNIPLRGPGQPPASPRGDRSRRVLYVGRLVDEKGPRDLALAGRAAGVRCSFVGDGALREELEAQFPEHELLGWRSAAATSALMAGARAVVLPSRWPETAGLAALEALQEGTPVLLSQAMCVADELRAAGGCRTFDGERPGALAEGLADIVSPRWEESLREAEALALRSSHARAYEAYFDRLEQILDATGA